MMQINRAAFVLGLLSVSWCYASDETSPANKVRAQEKLGRLKQDIRQLETLLQQRRQQHSNESRALRTVETGIASLHQQQRANILRIRQLNNRLAVTNRHYRKLQTRIEIHRQQLVQLIHTRYASGRHQALRLWLDRRAYGDYQRYSAYLLYVNRHRDHLQATLKKELAEQKQLAGKIRHDRKQLEELASRQEVLRKRLVQERLQRNTLLQTVEAQISRGGARLEQMRQHRKELQQVLGFLKRRGDSGIRVRSFGESRQPGSGLAGSFGRLRGKLLWPVPGRLISRFGRRQGQSNLHSRGVLIRAPLGQEVKAVASGRVVFANWLGNFGLIMIIDHGNNYLSLYGHNQSLLRKVGDRVKAGEVIASLGDSGGLRIPALYFEIRRWGIPQNPVRWCRLKR